MKVYHFLNSKYCLQALTEQRIKVSTLSDLNDPFELLSVDFSSKKLRHVFKELKNRISDKVGMICFSKNWNEPLLWSHYADRHKGCVLEFNIPDDELIHVRYQKNRVLIPNNIEKNKFNGYEKKLMSTKYISWKYEDEARLFLAKSDLIVSHSLFFYNFSKTFFPSKIIIGSLCKISKTNIKNSLPIGKKIIYLKSRLAFKTFSVVNNKNVEPSLIIGNSKQTNR